MKKLFLTLGGILLFSHNVNSQCYNLDTCWTKVWGYWVPLSDHLWDIEVSQSSGNVYVTGQTHNSFSPDFVTIKYDQAGVEQWTKTYNGNATQEDIAHSIAIDASENVYVTGEGISVADGKDYVTVKYNSAGVQQWVRTYDGTANGASDFAYSIFVDASENVHVTGEGNESGNGQDYVTIKYNSAGTVLWTAKYDGGTTYDVARKVVVDNSGNVYVTGESRRSGQAHNYVTVKYNSSGVQQWAAMYNSTANNDDDPTDLAVDNSGNVYVTGTSTGSFVSNKYYTTIKYNSSGVQLWKSDYFGVFFDIDRASAIYVDNAGNVFVTGESESANGADYLTIKYNSAGVEQWTARYDGTAHGDDVARSIVPGNNGKIYVGGGSPGSGTGDDMVLIEYDANTGGQCFVERTSIGNSQDNIYAIGMDAVRNVVYACGESTQGGGPHSMTARYCILGLVTTTYNVNEAIEGIYNPAVNRLNMKDTVRIYLRKNVSPFLIVDSAKAVLDSVSLLVSHTFYNAPSDIYYIVLKHRNSLETWSRFPGEPFTCGNVMNYDFTNASSKAYGNNMKQVDASPVKFAIFSGDVDQDGTVDAVDIVLTFNDAGNFSSGYLTTDENGDFFVDASDMVIVYNNAIEFVSLMRP